MTDDASTDARFSFKLDDPNYLEKNTDHLPARQILTMPVFTYSDMDQRCANQLAMYPRAIIHLINKKPNTPIS